MAAWLVEMKTYVNGKTAMPMMSVTPVTAEMKASAEKTLIKEIIPLHLDQDQPPLLTTQELPLQPTYSNGGWFWSL